MDNIELITLLNKELSICIAQNNTFQQVQLQLAAYINKLIQNDFNRLIAYLYRIDVDEQKLKILLQQKQDEDAGKIIAGLIIDRLQQKINTRRQFSQDKNFFDNEEKW
ncbi:MAG: hypothetical protein KF741_01795 [Ferruginibacter sp.]|nr:hypothetical protein [Bacteroidota bacterium]MBX2917951.1 hypothetical protein [Ferruginibacter sp.]MCB0709173.1 hypothetical protein [Chitinophagaceae bacterium]MCC7379423.1 hypothetical protein [Chitinophagaceae bacterium]